MESPTKIVLVDDDQALLECVGEYLERHENFQVVGRALHAQAGLALVLEKRPDVVLLDIHMPGADAFTICNQMVGKTAGQTKVLFFTGFPRDLYVDRAIEARAAGIVSKHSENMAAIGLAIRHVLRGNTYYSAELARRFAERDASGSDAPQSRFASLDDRELDVLRLLAMGKTNREIGVTLQISLRSVEKEVADLKTKLSLNTINELLVYAANEGLIFPELLYQQASNDVLAAGPE
jgi:DNA-binding NarL/FixJ family response regulator